MIKYLLKDVQIVSAVIWAVTIVGSSIIVKDSNLSILLLTAAGIHFVALNSLYRRGQKTCK